MKLRLILPALALVLLAGCGASVSEIPDGLDWTARTLQSQETGEILAAAEGTAFQGVPLLDLTAQVEGGTVTLTDNASGERWSGDLGPGEADGDGTLIFPLAFPEQPECYAVYGVTEHADGYREATLYLAAPDGRTLQLSAPLAGEA